HIETLVADPEFGFARNRDWNALTSRIKIRDDEHYGRHATPTRAIDQVNAVGERRFTGERHEVGAVATADRNQHVVHRRFFDPNFNRAGLPETGRIECQFGETE